MMFKKLREHNRDLGNRGVVFILIGIAGLSAIFSALMRGGLDNNWWADVSQGLVTEMAGAIATFWLINLIFEGRRQREQKTEAIAERKAALIRQMGSQINEEAIRAVEELGAHGWLEDGSLQEANLEYANLQKADLVAADLQGAILESVDLQGAILGIANLQKADLTAADLRGADLGSANLQKAKLEAANLRGADLRSANLQGADLGFADLRGANLMIANLHGARLKDVKFDEFTTLPDQTKWTPEIDMTRFTDPSHPEFWHSDNTGSPAY